MSRKADGKDAPAPSRAKRTAEPAKQKAAPEKAESAKPRKARRKAPPASALETTIGYRFKDPDLLERALTHISALKGQGRISSYQRLEFLGDHVLGLAVSEMLFAAFPKAEEGELSRRLADLVRRESCAEVARAIDLGTSLRLGASEVRAGGRTRIAILADVCESLIGAVFLDGGFEAARRVIVTAYGDELALADPATLGKDPKTRLQEWLQARRIAVPEYAVVGTHGEAHAQQFAVECRIPALGVAAPGIGASRRAAEQDAAERAWSEVAAPSAARRGERAP